MNILVTAGNTQTPIDKVRCLTNIFSGRTGGRLAVEAARRGHAVTLFTSHPEVLADLAEGPLLPSEHWQVKTYRTYDDLSSLMHAEIPQNEYDAIIHAAAVSDYALAGVFASGKGGVLDDVSAGKVKSHYPELWLRLIPTPKLVDLIRKLWGFSGALVKFKLEVGLSETALQEVAEQSRLQSGADLIVANTLEGMADWALVGPRAGGVYEKVSRGRLAPVVLDVLEEWKKSRV
jgi:phosphopantothenate---cysteine ligase (CTP)